MERHFFRIKKDSDLTRIPHIFGMTTTNARSSSYVPNYDKPENGQVQHHTFRQGDAWCHVTYNELTGLVEAETNLFMVSDVLSIFVLYAIEWLDDRSEYEEL